MNIFHPTPAQCDACGWTFSCDVGTEMFDTSPGQTTRGPWGCICRDCFNLSHGTLGIGKGQRYERQPDGKFLMMEGGSELPRKGVNSDLLIHPLLRED